MSIAVDRRADTGPPAGGPVGARPGPAGRTGMSRAEFRGDIQGLRAVAVLLVLGYHAGLPFLPGGFVGVDVFFVISGFLITGLIVREVERTGRLSLSSFWARRARRLLPATAVVLAATALMTLVALPFTRWPAIAWDLLTSALYVVNWRLADQAVDYLASDTAPSPLQHFWSLAVEEQFYILWPLLIMALLVLQQRTGWSLRRVLLAGITVIALPSLVWSVALTGDDPGRAYFVSTTRLWELAIGAALAIVATRAARLPVVAAHLLGWLGLAAIAVAALTFDAATPFPGYPAALPTLGAAAVLAAGCAHERHGAGALLSLGPMQDVGALSYSLYLWHWPLLIGATAVWGRPDGSLWVPFAVMVVGFAVVPAWLTYRLVEAPIHHARMFARFPWRAALLGVACTAVGVGAAFAVSASLPRPSYSGDDAAPGAAVLDTEPAGDPDGQVVDTVEAMTPDVLAAPDDMPTLDGEDCIASTGAVDLEPCVAGADDAEVTIAVVGDSKMHQWIGALERIAEQRGWKIVTYLKNSCPLTRADVDRNDAVYEECGEYNDRRYAALLDDDSIDYVLTSQRDPEAYIPDAERDERARVMADDLVRSWAELEEAGREVIVLVDNPNPILQVMDCVAANPHSLGECAFDREKGLPASGATAQRPALDRSAGVAEIDLNDYICPGDTCPAVIGNVLVYRQGSHLTATYADTLTPRLDEALVAAMDS